MANEVLYEALEMECLDTIRKTVGGRSPLLPVRESPAWMDGSSERLIIFTDPKGPPTRGLVIAAAVLGTKVAELALEKVPAGIRCQMRVAFRRGDVGDVLGLRVGWSLEPA